MCWSDRLGNDAATTVAVIKDTIMYIGEVKVLVRHMYWKGFATGILLASVVVTVWRFTEM